MVYETCCTLLHGPSMLSMVLLPEWPRGVLPSSYLLTVPVIWGPPSPKVYPALLSQACPPSMPVSSTTSASLGHLISANLQVSPASSITRPSLPEFRLLVYSAGTQEGQKRGLVGKHGDSAAFFGLNHLCTVVIPKLLSLRTSS